MKIDRLMGIVTLLLKKERMTAPELAEIFEVSKRTIYRDIDDLCMAGIPVVTFPGGDGGIAIAEGYKLDKNVLSTKEVGNVVAALEGIRSVTSDAMRIDGLIRKLSATNDKVQMAMGEMDGNNMRIDLASYYKNSLSEKISILNQAIHEHKVIQFDYYSDKGCTRRNIEPYVITFRWAAWYVFGYCQEKSDFRLFKLNRLWELVSTEHGFTPREVPAGKLETSNVHKDENKVVVDFDPSVEYRLVEDYGPGSYKILSDGKLRFEGGYTNEAYIISWIMAFGDKARVIEPEFLADGIKQRAKNIVQCYERDI